MTAKELKKYIDKDVYHYNRRYHEKTPYILKGVRSDRKQGTVYAVLQDINDNNSYIATTELTRI